MEPIIKTFTLLTPAFVHGAYQSQQNNRPELRPPSVKGQLHWWYAALFGQERDGHAGKDELELFGHVSDRRRGLEGNEASLFSIRVIEETLQETKADVLPHKKREGLQGTKASLAPGSRFTLQLLPRRQGPKPEQWQRLQRATDAWLLLGGIGQRANRAAGSLWPEDAPETSLDFERKAGELLAGSRLKCAVLDRSWPDEDKLRSDVSNILADQAMAHCGRPFGTAGFYKEGIPRKPSPLKLRAVRFSGQLRVVAVWDARHGAGDLREGVRVLRGGNKPLGTLLEPVLEKLLNG
jgi:CRISPR type III-B/RAMP module RAMP protein Cmr1